MATEIERDRAACGAPLPEVLQVKEKLGVLRFYLDRSDERLHDIIGRAEQRSAQMCEVCGAHGRLHSDSRWLRTRCDAHSDRRAVEME